MRKEVDGMIPGFTADASLSYTSEHYRLANVLVDGTDGKLALPKQMVVPQRIKLKDVQCACDTHSDICVCDDGSVFHQVLGLI